MTMTVGQHTPERRQTPRVAVGNAIECRLDLRTRVRLLDISLSGALLGAELALPVGASAQLQSGLGASAFRTDVLVRRDDGLPVGITLNGLGAAFTTMDD